LIIVVILAAAIVGILFWAERRFPSYADPVVGEQEPQFTDLRTAPSTANGDE
jgi:hypothetical protein